MKVLKKISLVYTLQVLAVILLFSFAGSSDGKESKEPVSDAAFPFKIKKEKSFNPNRDSSLTGNINVLWK